MILDIQAQDTGNDTSKNHEETHNMANMKPIET